MATYRDGDLLYMMNYRAEPSRGGVDFVSRSPSTPQPRLSRIMPMEAYSYRRRGSLSPTQRRIHLYSPRCQDDLDELDQTYGYSSLSDLSISNTAMPQRRRPFSWQETDHDGYPLSPTMFYRRPRSPRRQPLTHSPPAVRGAKHLSRDVSRGVGNASFSDSSSTSSHDEAFGSSHALRRNYTACQRQFSKRMPRDRLRNKVAAASIHEERHHVRRPSPPPLSVDKPPRKPSHRPMSLSPTPLPSDQWRMTVGRHQETASHTKKHCRRSSRDAQLTQRSTHKDTGHGLEKDDDSRQASTTVGSSATLTQEQHPEPVDNAPVVIPSGTKRIERKPLPVDLQGVTEAFRDLSVVIPKATGQSCTSDNLVLRSPLSPNEFGQRGIPRSYYVPPRPIGQTDTVEDNSTAKPAIKEVIPNDHLVEHANDCQPTFWNPRQSRDTAPVARRLSSRIRGLLQPQRTKLSGLTQDQYTIARLWSVERPMTPQDTSLTSLSGNTPFVQVRNSIAVSTQPLPLYDIKDTDFDQVDTYAINVQQRGDMLTPEILAQKFLVRPYRRDLYKVRSIFIWILHNIAMVTDANEHDAGDETVNQVFNQRSCHSAAGIARLFCTMAEAAGLRDTNVVFGCLRGGWLQAKSSEGQALTDHAWCAVNIDGEYRFVDCWLASPWNLGNQSRIEYHWFLTHPTDMIYTHFPNDNSQQFLVPPIQEETFLCLPHILTPFFRNHLQVIHWDGDVVHQEGQVFHLTLAVQEGVGCYAEVESRAQVDDDTHDQKAAAATTTTRGLAQCTQWISDEGETHWVCKIKAFLPPGHGKGWLKVYAGPRIRPDLHTAAGTRKVQEPVNASHYPLALCFQVTQPTSMPTSSLNSTPSLPHPFGFVQLYICQYDIYIQEPQCYELYPLQSYKFCIKSDKTHHKLAIRSPTGRLHKLVYFPQDYTYDGSLTVNQVGTWSLICLLHHAGGSQVIASWECKT